MRFSKKKEPTTLSILGFAVLILIGTGLLSLPGASEGEKLGFIDALFTATSATCVTGLVVVDTGSSLSPLGQAVVLVLIQIGGLGIMTVSTIFLLMAGRRPSLAGRIVVRDTFTHGGERRLRDFILDVVRFTLILEGAGALILFFRFLLQYSPVQALYLAVFHSVSAFCNAGFSPFPESLLPYQGDWVVNLTVGGLVFSGGIGFLVMTEIKRSLPFGRRMWARLSLHSKLVLSTSGILLLLGTLSILLMEWRNTLSGLPLTSRLLTALFQSVTARTAGFNTVPIGDLANETLFLLILLMFVGASSGSCGGGIKTGTLAVLVTLSLSKIRGHERPQVFGRALTQESVGRAVGLVLASSAIVVFATLALLASELGGVSHARTQGRFLSLLFEVVSAFGTVGLSMGETPNLSPLGRLIITGVMFVGRLGPLAVGVALSRRRTLRYHYAEEGIMIG